PLTRTSPSSPTSKVLLLIMARRRSLFTEIPLRARFPKLAIGSTTGVVDTTAPRRFDFGKNGSRPKSGRSMKTDWGGGKTSATVGGGAGAAFGAAKLATAASV